MPDEASLEYYLGCAVIFLLLCGCLYICRTLIALVVMLYLIYYLSTLYLFPLPEKLFSNLTGGIPK